MEENKEAQVEETIEKTAEETGKESKTDRKKLKKLEADLAELQKKLDQAEAEIKEDNDKYLRMMAEYENFRKRSQKEKDSTYADAYGDCISSLLPVLDNLERAAGCDNLDGVKKGLEMTVKAFDDALEKMGVTEIECKTFDPNVHNAVMHVEDETLGEGEIVEVFQKGYQKGDKIIRCAMVKVAN